MIQKNYIKSYTPLSLNEINATQFSNEQLYEDQFFNFTGFLFYLNSWSWGNITNPSNLDYDGMRDYFQSLSDNNTLNFSDPVNAIKYIKNNKSPLGGNFANFVDGYRFVELFLMAATCRRYEIYSQWREQFSDIVRPKFLDNYGDNMAPILEGETTWNIWAGDIQGYTDAPNGQLSVGNFVFCKNMTEQLYSPVSIERSSSNFKYDKGYGEILYTELGGGQNYITNYYNASEAYLDELLPLNDGWYGLVTLDSAPFIIEPGKGIDFDTFFKLESNKIVEFHPEYSGEDYFNILSEYGQQKTEYIDL